MDVSTGQIGTKEELLDEGSKLDDLVAIRDGEMTAKQHATRLVSKQDNRSTLGKVRVEWNRMTPNQRKRARKKNKARGFA